MPWAPLWAWLTGGMFPSVRVQMRTDVRGEQLNVGPLALLLPAPLGVANARLRSASAAGNFGRRIGATAR